MPSNAGLLMQLLGSFIGDSTPQRNPYFKIDEQGNPIGTDPNTGKVVTQPYATPGFGTKLFHDNVAQYETGENNRFADAQNNANLANAVRNKVNAGNASVVQNDFLKSKGHLENADPNALGIGGVFTPSALNNYATEGANYAAGNPFSSAQAIAGQLGLTNRMQNWEAEHNLPEAEAANRLASAQYGTDLNTGNRGLLADEFKNRGLRLESERAILPSQTSYEIARNQAGTNEFQNQLDNANVLKKTFANRAQADALNSGVNLGLAQTSSDMLPTQRATLASELAAAGFRAKVGNELAKEQADNVATLVQTQRNEEIGREVMSWMIPPSQSPIGTRINPDKTISFNERDPRFVNPKIAQLAGLSNMANGTGQTLSGALKARGNDLPMASNKVNPATMEAVDSSENRKPIASIPAQTEDVAGVKISPQTEFNASPLSTPKQEAPKQEQKKELMNYRMFLQKLFTQKASSKYRGDSTWHQSVTPSQATLDLAKYLGNNIRLPSTRLNGMDNTTAYLNALNGYDKSPVSRDEIGELLSQLPPEEVDKVLTQALNNANY